ncbi:MAG: hypothetical protein HYY16_14105 [Planctomycetes bacterium]|nr:hypothetical protein [Planctomycetota bacterium]
MREETAASARQIEDIKEGLKVADIPATLAQVEKAGGRTLKTRTPVIEGSQEYGFFALFADPNGNRLGLWSRT